MQHEENWHQAEETLARDFRWCGKLRKKSESGTVDTFREVGNRLFSRMCRLFLRSLLAMSTPKTLFQRIIEREIPAKIVHEDELSLAFHDVSPQSPVHILVIPKKEIPSLADITPADVPLMGHLFLVVKQIAAAQGLVDGFRTVINTGRDGGQTVNHLHIHLMGKRALGWPPG